jgi:hypothetical protein
MPRERCEHVAILLRRYLEAILRGEKTIEARLARTRQAPFNRVRTGDRLWLKESSGPFRASAIVERVVFHDDLTPARLRMIRARHGSAIGGAPEFWIQKRAARCATLLWLADVREVSEGPRYRHIPGGRAWYVLAA